MTDWTKQPLGAARKPLGFRAATLLRLILGDASPHLIDEELKIFEKCVKAFRDNKR